MRGLADTLPANVTLYENSPVTTFENQNGITLTTQAGSIRAPKMILAANGFAEQFGHFKNRIIHLAGFGSISEPLTPAQRAAYNAPNQRVTPAQMARTKATHQRLLAKRFPAIADVKVEHTWAGFVALTKNSAPGFGQVQSNIWAATCQNAVGITKGTFSGMLAADLTSGQDNPLIADMLALGKPSPLPPRPFLDLGIRARFGWELFSNRREA